MNKNDIAWEKLFVEHDILTRVASDGHFEISALQINKYRESRLMTKFDHHVNLPKLFSENHLAILPLTRGTYVIGNFDAYKKVTYDRNIRNIIVPFPPHLVSINHTNISSESTALNCAYVTKIIDDLAGEEVLPTVSGRMSTNEFDFHINGRHGSHQILVKNSQCEIDGGYEGHNVLLLFEAKRERVRDFLIRQLYYPFRLWREKIRNKTVVPIFLTHSNDTYSFFKYSFEDHRDYNSLVLVEQRNYIVSSQTITMADLNQILNKTTIEPDSYTIPFPQADKFHRVMDLVGLLLDAETDYVENDFITTNYDFDTRQTSYYVAAGRYLGLIESSGQGKYRVSNAGRKIFSLPYYKKYLAIVRSIVSHEVFNKALKLYFSQANPPTLDQVVGIMRGSMIHGVESNATYHRRAQTVIRWIEWIIALDESE